MLRILVGLLVLLNLGYWTWSQGVLADWGMWTQVQHQQEPERLERQVHPERIRLLAADAPEITAPVSLGETAVVLSNNEESTTGTTPVATDTQTTSAPASATSAAEPSKTLADPAASALAAPSGLGCKQTAYFNEKERPRIEALFKAALPEGSWMLSPVPQPARWIVYTGKLSGAEAVAETKAQLRELKIGYRDVPTALQPGLALGTFSSEEAAQQGVRDVARNGYKGAKAVMERQEYEIYTLRLPQVTEELKIKASAVLSKQGEGKAAKNWQTCTE